MYRSAEVCAAGRFRAGSRGFVRVRADSGRFMPNQVKDGKWGK
jgi:hypothetical protein